MRRPAAALLALLAGQTVTASTTLAEPAIGQFELKGLEAEPGGVEFQSQNAWSFGNPRRRVGTDGAGDPVFDANAVARQRHALEIELSLARWLRTRVGVEYEKERLDDPPSPAFANAYGALELTEVAVEGVVILKPVPEGGVGFGMLTEFEHSLEPGAMNKIIFGPIIGATSGPWSTLLNVLFIHHFGAGEVTDDGIERDDKWDLGYAMQVKYTFDSRWALALEGYGTFDRLGDTGERSEGAATFGDHDQHRAGPLLYYTWHQGGDDQMQLGRVSESAGGEKSGEAGDDKDVTVTLGTGVLFGLNDNTPAATIKASLEIEF